MPSVVGGFGDAVVKGGEVLVSFLEELFYFGVLVIGGGKEYVCIQEIRVLERKNGILGGKRGER